MKIPEGVRIAQEVPQEECNKCGLGPTDHTVNFSFPIPEFHGGVAYQLVCLKDWEKYKKKGGLMEEEKDKTALVPAVAAEEKPTVPAPPAKKARTDLKVSIIIKGDHIFLAAQANDTDPKMTTLKGDLTAALARASSFVDECNAQWDVAAKNPEAPQPVTPPPAPRTASPSSSGSKPAASKTSAAAPAKQPAQPKFF